MPTLPKRNKAHWIPERKPFDTGRVTERWTGYNTERWRGFRRIFRIKYPTCSEPGCEQPTYYVDHTIPVLKLVAMGRDPFNENECRPKCFRHGNVKTGHEGQAKQQEYKEQRKNSDTPGGL